MKKSGLIFILAIVLAAGAIGARPAPSYAQGYAGYTYPPPPQNIYATPWVGSNTPWVFYQGDWFLRGVLYYFFGPQYGWAPYYAYPPTYIIRPVTWYEPRWHHWYQGHPQYWQTFQRQYPYWQADTRLASGMTRIFTTGIIPARVQVGIKDSTASVRLRPLAMASAPREPLVLARIHLGRLSLVSINPEKPLLARKDRSSSSSPGA